MREKLMTLLEPSVNALGYELVELEYHPGRGRAVVRIFIDRDGGVGLDDCERVSEQVSGLLDVEDPIPGQYVLEVSSPGVDRVLRKREHFEAFTGHRVRVRTRTLRAGRRQYTGQLLELDREEIVLEVDGEAVRLPLADIEKARLAPDI